MWFMKKSYLIPILLFALLVTSCSTLKEQSPTEPPVSEPEEPPIVDDGGGDNNNDDTGSDTPPTVPDDGDNEEPSTGIPSSNQMLPIGNRTVTGPDNYNNPDDITEWKEYDFYNSMPNNWAYIQGNNKVNSKTNFYAESAGGGFKFAQLYYGLQTPLINGWEKIEIRLEISCVNNNSQKKDDDEPIFHVYGYDINGQYISLDYIEQGAITTQTAGNYVRIYVRNINIRYLEFRLNAFPYKGQQCYNFGVSKISLKGWPYN